ncbi:MAG TPA: VOC family protein [Acidimicrobiia bacterium]|nr:VOC family protein [Acidimicrobiia bacterium]
MTSETAKLPKLVVNGIDHVVLHVRDVERAERFYVDVLGFEVAHGGGGHTFLRCGDQMVALFERGDDIHAGAEMNHLALRLAAADYDEVKAVLEAEGIEVTGRPGDDRCIYFRDPDGHRLQLLTPGEH